MCDCSGGSQKCDKINTSFVDLFHKRKLVKTVVIPTYNHKFMAFGLGNEESERLDKKLIQWLWTIKVEDQVKLCRRLVTKKRLGATYEMWGMKMDFSKTFQQMKLQSDRPRNKPNILYQLFEEKIQETDFPNINELFRIAEPIILLCMDKKWHKLKIISHNFSHVCMATANFMQSNKQHKQNWTTAYLAADGIT
jgi:hypothetical protein